MIASKEMIKKFLNLKYGLLLTATLVFWFLPEKTMLSEGGLRCMHLQILGFECPLCGMTRAAYFMVHLEPCKAMGYNFNALLLLLLICCDAFYDVSGLNWVKRSRQVVFTLLMLGFILIYGIRISGFFLAP